MASAASSSPPLLFFLLIIFTCFLLLPLSLDAQGTDNNTLAGDSPERLLSFSFDFSNASSYNAGDLRFEGNASVHGSLIDLTCHSFGESVEGCIGRMSYNHPVPFHDGTTLASFDTSFTFVIKPNNLPAPGDGLAFFLSGYPSSLPPDTDGGSLGLINDDTAAYGSNQFVAVEFDTYQNDDWGGSQQQPRRHRHQHRALCQYNRLEHHRYRIRIAKPQRWQRVNYAKRKSIVLATAVVAPILTLFVCGITSLQFIKRRRRGKGSQDKGEVNVKEEDAAALVWAAGRSSEFNVYDFLQVLEATNNFSEENKLGQGGFGPVYKGRFHDGLEIAVKRLASHSGQGFREFKNEIELIAKLQHTNLVRLIGCCSQGDERLLIYEYMPNKSLDFYIFDEIQRVSLDWNKRLAIIEGIAQGILYLHKHSRLRVIHRDLKASNILLDHEMNPKISDFGLAKIFRLNNTEGNTNRIVGTYGYMAPEYASEGLFSIKSDVFSFGVLTLEIIGGKRTSSVHQYGEFINLLGHAWQLWKDRLWLQLVDTALGTTDQGHALQLRRCINIALLCVQENAVDRPTMSEVVAMLCSESMALPEPKHPAYFHVRVGTKESSAVVETSSVDVTISVLHGR
ncbi:unnamed protein product [Urochloa decumbens]|uniref:non-specific serine/threonine protein kinase n=1 Tax=Urochloa decumbens TaxID=240449 RepID=A0ABC9B4A9_9POAL